MKKIRICLCLSIVWVCTIGYGQNRALEKAGDNFDDAVYIDAISTYNRLVEEGHSSQEIFSRLGDAHFINAEYIKAAKWYQKLFELKNTDVAPEYLYRYALCLKSSENYRQSDQWMEKFIGLRPEDKRGQLFVNNRDYLSQIRGRMGSYSLRELPINSTTSDLAPSYYKNQLVFSTTRDTGITNRKINRWNNQPFQKLYTTTINENGQFSKAIKFSKRLDSKAHESSAVFSKNGDTIYFTRNNFKNGNFSRDDQGFSRLKIYRANLKNGNWTNIIELPFNSDDYSSAHPCLSTDGKKLYFASDMSGSFGASDIFSVSIKSDGSFGKPENLGNHINTEGRETFPFVSESNILYFASDGHPGLGGLDIFATRMDDNCIINLGSPINSIYDDFSLVIDETNNTGFLTSNRDGGKGSDDIYAFTEETPILIRCTFPIEGIVKDEETGRLLKGVKIKLIGPGNKILTRGISEDGGTFHLESKYKVGEYKLLAKKEDYKDAERNFSMKKLNDASSMELVLSPIPMAASIGTNLSKYLNIQPIYFDLDSFLINENGKKNLDKVANYMQKFPAVHIEIRSHTDAKGTEKYNYMLSGKRAKATVEYLISKEIVSTRISLKAFGESQLMNDCSVSEKCSEKKNSLNRRSDIIVIK